MTRPPAARLLVRLAVRAALLVSVLVSVLAGVLAAPHAAAAQSRLATGFERDVNRYRWTSEADVAGVQGAWRFTVRNRFASDAFALTGDGRFFRDEDRFSALLERPLSDRLTARVVAAGAWFGQSRVLTTDLLAGLRVTPRPWAVVEPRAGVAFDQRPGALVAAETPPLRQDVGPAVGVAFSGAPPAAADYALEVSGEAGWQVITPRRAGGARIEGRAERSFGEAVLALETRYARLRRDAYQAVSFLNRNTTGRSESIEATRNDTLEAALALTAPLRRATRLEARADFGANGRAVVTRGAPTDALAFDTDFDRRALVVSSAVVHEASRLAARLAVETGAEVERRRLTNRAALPPAQAAQKALLLEQADFDRGHVALSARARADLHPRLSLSFDGTASLLRHDTPDVNPDDRDEVYHNARLGLLVRGRRYLQFDVVAFGTYYHTVYLDATRSAENNRQRSLHLRPTLRYTPGPSTRFRLASEVRATYTVDDFVLAGRRPQDQSARELRYEVGAEHDFGDGLRLRADGSVSDLMLGRLFWDRFAEIPFDTLRTMSGWVRLGAEPWPQVVAEIGVRAFVRRDYDRAVTVRYAPSDAPDASAVITRPGRTWIEQMGPTCRLAWQRPDGALLRLEGWLNVQHVRRTLHGPLPEAVADRIRRAARAGERRVIPNVTLTAAWTL